MSYTSESTFRPSTRLQEVRDTVELLGYQVANDGLKIPNRVGSYMWFESRDYRSWVGVELGIYKKTSGQVTVSTRSRLGRSTWDLVHQNRTLKFLRDLFGGSFTTDAGRNRYWKPDGTPPTPAQSGCYLARWRLQGASQIAELFLQNRSFPLPLGRPEPTGISYMDELNPRLFSNNLLLPYLIGIWEEFHKSCFAALLRYSERRSVVLKEARLSHERLEEMAAGSVVVEDAVAEAFSFQRPSSIATAFRFLDPTFNYTGVLKRRYRRRRVSLFDSIEELVEKRHSFVHSGALDTSFTDSKVKAAIKDFEAAVERIYARIGECGGWKPIYDYKH